MPHIELRNVSKVFGPNGDRALRMASQGKTRDEINHATGAIVGVFQANFTVERGEIFVVMGLSGSGKSTLIRCVNRIHHPTAGRVIVDGTDVTGLNARELQAFRRRRCAMVFQRFSLFPHRSVWANVAYGLEINGVPTDERRRRAEEVLEMVGLAGWGDRRPDELSGGMQQRVGLARALAVDPEILLMDEAFSALDPLIKREMQDELLTLQSRMQKTILFITHDLDEALKLGDRIAVMKDGLIEQIGGPEEIVSRPASDYVAAFTAGVDRSKVLTAGAVMKDPEPVVRPKDGPNTALTRMRRSGISSIFLVDSGGQLIGLITADAARVAADRGATSLDEAVSRDVAKIDLDTPLHEILALGETTWPLAVVDGFNRLRGVIVKGAILGALASGQSDADDEAV